MCVFIKVSLVACPPVIISAQNTCRIRFVTIPVIHPSAQEFRFRFGCMMEIAGEPRLSDCALTDASCGNCDETNIVFVFTKCDRRTRLVGGVV